MIQLHRHLPLLSSFIVLKISCDTNAFLTYTHKSNRLHIHQKQEDSSEPTIEFEDALYLERFKRRRFELSSASPEPKEVVTSILTTLRTPHQPSLNCGYEYLYTSSTEKWQYILRKSVGATNNTEEEVIHDALRCSMEREGQQFGILVGMGLDDGTFTSSAIIHSGINAQTEKEYYSVEFPYDTLDYHDGTAWVECRLRNKQTDTLLVVIGWSLEQFGDQWLIDGIDWQDFREKYRPGIGREEWERICG